MAFNKVEVWKVAKDYITSDQKTADKFKNQQARIKAGQKLNANEIPAFPNNTYVGQAINDIFRYLAFYNLLTKQDLVTQRTGVKFRGNGLVLDTNVILQDESGTFSNALQRPKTFTPYAPEPVHYSMQDETNYLEFYKTWASQIGSGIAAGSLQNRFAPEMVMQAIFDEILEQIPLMHDKLYLTGKASGTGHANFNTPGALFNSAYEGFYQKLNSAVGNVKLQTPSAPITAINGSGTNLVLTCTGASIKAGDSFVINGLGNGTGTTGTYLNKREYVQNTNVISVKNAVPLQVISVTPSGGSQLVEINVLSSEVTVGTPVFTNALFYFVNENNVQNVVLSFWQSISEVLRQSEDFKIWVHPQIKNALLASEATRLGGSVVNYGNTNDISLIDKRLYVLPNLPVGTMIGIEKTNAEIILDDSMDFSDLRMIDMLNTTGDKTIRTLMSFATCVGVPKPKETIILRPF
jgi:hypothetical protein